MKIEVTTNFHYGRYKFLTPGIYRVPDQLDPSIADAAVKAGVAVRKEVEAVPVSDGFQPARRSRKGPAPENKARGRAPHDKAAVD